MIKIDSKHLQNEPVKKILEEIESNIFIDCEKDEKKLLRKFIKNKDIPEKDFIHDLIFDELRTLEENRDYYIDDYCKIVLWRNETQINNLINRKQAIQELKQILGTDSKLKNNFFPKFRNYSTEDLKSKKSFKPCYEELIELVDEINDKLLDIFSYEKYVVPHRIALLNAMNIEVCPYCNNKPIMTDTEKNVSEADIEHHLMKANFAIFSSSFGNILPSCKSCNTTHKNVSMLRIINPRVESFDTGASFKVKCKGIDNLYKDNEELIKSDEMEIILDIFERNIEKKRRIINSNRLFSIEKQYNTQPIKKITRELFLDFRDRNSYFYKEAVNELVDGKNYSAFMIDKIMKFESGSYDKEDHVNVLHIKLKYDLYINYVKENNNLYLS